MKEIKNKKLVILALKIDEAKMLKEELAKIQGEIMTKLCNRLAKMIENREPAETKTTTASTEK
jgi:hypothetical protein